MKLANTPRERLNTKNFRKVYSKALISLDYNTRLKIVEIEYSTGNIYHYLNIGKKSWNAICSIIENDKSLGTFINTEFKAMIENEDHDYYELIVGRKGQAM